MAAIFRYCFVYMFVRLLRLSIVKGLKRYIYMLSLFNVKYKLGFHERLFRHRIGSIEDSPHSRTKQYC